MGQLGFLNMHPSGVLLLGKKLTGRVRAQHISASIIALPVNLRVLYLAAL
jgi:hypothetical protein